jgi:putative transposase
MPAVGFRFRAHAGQRTSGALRAQLRLACEVYNAMRRADIDFHRRNGRGLTLTELRQLALDLRRRNEDYQQLHSQVAQGDRRPVPQRQAEVPRGRARGAGS